MADNPFEAICQTFEKISRSVQTHLSQIVGIPQNSPTKEELFHPPSVSLKNTESSTTIQQSKDLAIKKKTAQPVSKEELGRATWTFLHTLGAQYPEKPTRQQKKDVKELMAILSRMYPCKECADHFKEVLRANPVQVVSQAEFSQWLCHAHNIVNRSLGKLVFPCERVDARWGKLECEHRACDLQGTTLPWQ